MSMSKHVGWLCAALLLTAACSDNGGSPGKGTGGGKGATTSTSGNGGMPVGQGGSGGAPGDGGPWCQAGLMECSGKCVDIQTDPANCGGCGQICTAGMTCAGGVCSGPACAGKLGLPGPGPHRPSASPPPPPPPPT